MTIHVSPGPENPHLRLFTVDDLRRMQEAGILSEDERVELLDGELVGMAAKGYAHELVKNGLNRLVVPALPASIYLGIESTLQLAPRVLLEPDLLFAPMSSRRASPEGFCTIPGPEILLVIEVAVSSLAYDRGRKAALYARHGVQEYWVIDAQERSARVHAGPGATGYDEVAEIGRDGVLCPRAAALGSLAVALPALS